MTLVSLVLRVGPDERAKDPFQGGQGFITDSVYGDILLLLLVLTVIPVGFALTYRSPKEKALVLLQRQLLADEVSIPRRCLSACLRCLGQRQASKTVRKSRNAKLRESLRTLSVEAPPGTPAESRDGVAPTSVIIDISAAEQDEATLPRKTAHTELATESETALERDRERLETELGQATAELASVREEHAAAIAAADARHKELQTRLDEATAAAPEPLLPQRPALGRWLHEAKLAQYEEAATSQGYDLELLRNLDDDEAASVAAELVPAERGADRMRLRKAVQKLREQGSGGENADKGEDEPAPQPGLDAEHDQ